jgi:polyhydroxyalkanoate synthesis regulator protein
MDSFRRNQEQFRSAIEGALSGGPFEELHKRNMAMIEAATSILRPGASAEARKDEPAAKADGKDAEIAALKAQLASLQDKIDKLG